MDTLKSSQNHDSKSPNYMKSTTSSDSKKETRTLTGSVRTLMKKHSFKPVRVKATCSSTLKDSKFPDFVKLNNGGTEAQGASAMRVCPYLYCSLNGHHHDPSPPLKTFLKAKRRSLKTQNGGGKVIIEPEAAMEEEGDSSESFDLEWSEVDGEYVGTMLKVVSEVTDQIVDSNFHVDGVTDQNKEEYDGVLDEFVVASEVTNQIVDSNFHVDGIVPKSEENGATHEIDTQIKVSEAIDESVGTLLKVTSKETYQIVDLNLHVGGIVPESKEKRVDGQVKVEVIDESIGNVLKVVNKVTDHHIVESNLYFDGIVPKSEENEVTHEVEAQVEVGEVIDESVGTLLKVASEVTGQIVDFNLYVNDIVDQNKEESNKVSEDYKQETEFEGKHEVDEKVLYLIQIEDIDHLQLGFRVECEDVDFQDGPEKMSNVGVMQEQDVIEDEIQWFDDRESSDVLVTSAMGSKLESEENGVPKFEVQVKESEVVDFGSMSEVVSEMTEVDVQVKESEVIDFGSLSEVVNEMLDVDTQVKEGEVIDEFVGSLLEVVNEMPEVDAQGKEGEIIDELVGSLSKTASEMPELDAQIKEGEAIDTFVGSLVKVVSELTEVDVQVKEGEDIDKSGESLSNVVNEMTKVDAQVKEGETIDESARSLVNVLIEITEVDAQVKEGEANNESVESLSKVVSEMTYQVIGSRLHTDSIVDQNETKSDRALHHQQETESEAKDKFSELKSSFEVQNANEHSKSNSNPKLTDAFISKPSKSQEMLREADLNTKRIIGSKKLIEKLNAYTSFNPREPNYLPIVPEKESEKIDLKHQIIDERRNGNEWMIDYALQQTVTKLAPARKRRVALLVEAFESVLPMPSYELPPKPVFAHARPIQACN